MPAYFFLKGTTKLCMILPTVLFDTVCIARVVCMLSQTNQQSRASKLKMTINVGSQVICTAITRPTAICNLSFSTSDINIIIQYC